MKPLAFVLGIALAIASGAEPRPVQTAPDVIAKVLAAQRTVGFTMRARLVTGEPGENEPAVVQVRILGRRDATATRVLYQALWPAGLKGQAVYIQRDRAEAVTGFLFEPPDRTTTLTGASLSQPLFDSELALDDLVEEFWSWPNPIDVGEDTVEKQRCRVIELRAPARSAGSYDSVRACISMSRMLPMRIEKVRSDGRVARRFVVTRALKGDSGGWAPARIQVETPGRSRTTTIEVSRGERDIIVPASEFSLEKIKSLGK